MNNKYLKRISSLLLALAILFSVVPAVNTPIYAEEVKLEEAKEISVSLKLIDNNKKEIGNFKDLKLKEDQTVADLMKKLNEEEKLQLTMLDTEYGPYITEINGIKAGLEHAYDGWIDTINGQSPEVGIGEQKLKAGDKVVFSYYNHLDGKAKLVVEGPKEAVFNGDFVPFKEGENALDFFKRALDEKKVEYKIESSEYGPYISKIGNLEQFGLGKNSGWTYKVDGQMPMESLDKIELKRGMEINFLFVKDFTNMPVGEDKFSDLEATKWAKEAVNTLAEAGVIKGTDQFIFSPKKDVSRAEFVKMLSGILGLEEIGELKFKDVKKDDWFYEDIAKMTKKGYIQGRDEKTFDPQGKISRQEIAKIIGSIIKAEVKDQKKGDLKNFKDAGEISKWAEEGVELSAANGIVIGHNDKFNPKSKATRAESAVMIYRLRDLIK